MTDSDIKGEREREILHHGVPLQPMRILYLTTCNEITKDPQLNDTQLKIKRLLNLKQKPRRNTRTTLHYLIKTTPKLDI